MLGPYFCILTTWSTRASIVFLSRYLLVLTKDTLHVPCLRQNWFSKVVTVFILNFFSQCKRYKHGHFRSGSLSLPFSALKAVENCLNCTIFKFCAIFCRRWQLAKRQVAAVLARLRPSHLLASNLPFKVLTTHVQIYYFRLPGVLNGVETREPIKCEPKNMCLQTNTHIDFGPTFTLFFTHTFIFIQIKVD